MSESLLHALPLIRRPFPRGAHLWVVLDHSGVRREIVERGRSSDGAWLPHLRPVDLRVHVGRSRYPVLVGVESPLSWRAPAPAPLLYTQWLGDIVDLGTAPDDPHPELWAILVANAGEGDAANVPRASWGEAATAILGCLGVWAPPARCPRCGARPDGRAASELCCADCAPLTREDLVLTNVGLWTLPLFRWLHHVDDAVEAAFSRRPTLSAAVIALGRRGIL